MNKEKRKKEELQTRREFFKNAAKSALPIMAAIALSGMPHVVKAMGNASSVCDTCQGGCRYTCSKVCNSSCKGTCNNTCYKTCLGSCSDTCYGGCKKAVKY